VKAVKFLMPPKDYRVFGNDSFFELPSKAAIGIRSVIVVGFRV
jgi:hypothetical protein